MKELRKILEQLDIDYKTEIPKMIEKFQLYKEHVLQWNEKVNLTAITDSDEFDQKHFIDSVLCADSRQVMRAAAIVDLGTGAGFPGVPLAILFPEKEFLLVDSVNKKIKIVEQGIELLGLANVKAIHGRAEELARKKEYREVFDLCVSRAVANLSTLSEYCLPFVKKGGDFLAYKGPDCEGEIKEAGKIISLTGGVFEKAETSSVLNHTFVYIHKEKSTPEKYPRKAGTPSKQPIK